MLFTHKLHMGEGAGQTSAGHRAPNTDVRADSHAGKTGSPDATTRTTRVGGRWDGTSKGLILQMP